MSAKHKCCRCGKVADRASLLDLFIPNATMIRLFGKARPFICRGCLDSLSAWFRLPKQEEE